MKKTLQVGCLLLGLLFIANNALAQTTVTDTVQKETTVNKGVEKDWAYLGIGFGLDYGGFGLRVEYIPVKWLGLYAGLGYNYAPIGFNVGVAIKCLPSKRVCPNILAMFGSNAVFKGMDSYAERYDMTSFGPTFGASLDFLVGKRGNKITVGLLFPIRSSKFMDNFDDAQSDPFMDTTGDFSPVLLTAGFNFHL